MWWTLLFRLLTNLCKRLGDDYGQMQTPKNACKLAVNVCEHLRTFVNDYKRLQTVVDRYYSARE